MASDKPKKVYSVRKFQKNIKFVVSGTFEKWGQNRFCGEREEGDSTLVFLLQKFNKVGFRLYYTIVKPLNGNLNVTEKAQEQEGCLKILNSELKILDLVCFYRTNQMFHEMQTAIS